jgi:hypothetical protein
MGGNNSVVECNLAKVEVASSNLVSRSKKKSTESSGVPFFFAPTFTKTFTRKFWQVRGFCFLATDPTRGAGRERQRPARFDISSSWPSPCSSIVNINIPCRRLRSGITCYIYQENMLRYKSIKCFEIDKKVSSF